MQWKEAEKMERDYDSDISIDPNALDVEWIRQAKLFMDYSRLQAAAKRKVNELEQRLKVIRSQLLLEAREAGAKNGGQEEAYYRTHPKHQEAKKEWLDAQYENDILDGAVFAFHQKKAALENLVHLQGQNYFAAPAVPRDIGKEWAKGVQHQAMASKIKQSRIVRRD